jgi:homoserine O-acetyltransferase/O-succinyltransferase
LTAPAPSEKLKGVKAQFLLAAFLLAAPSFAQELKFADLGDFHLESGETVRDCRIAYRTFGTLNAGRTNAVLFPTWFGGTTKDLVELVGPGKLVDSTNYFVITVDALGDGVSTSPSNSKLQPHMKFPKFSIGDMVNSERQLVEKELRIPHLRGVIGISMGGMQTFQWMVAHPDFMDRAIPIVGSPKLTSYDLLLWQAGIHAIQADINWKGGDYSAPPEAGLRTLADIDALAIQTPGYRVRHTPPEDTKKFLDANEQGAIHGFDANDWIRQAQAMMGHDVSRPWAGDMAKAAAAVKARVLIVVGLQDHMVNPQPALAFARLLQASTLELDSDCGHVVTSCEGRKIGVAVAKFLVE